MSPRALLPVGQAGIAALAASLITLDQLLKKYLTAQPAPAHVPVYVSIAILVTTCFYLYKGKDRPYTQIFLTLIIAGAFSNLVDQVVDGAILDPFSLGRVQYNLADLAIIIGALGILVNLPTKMTRE